MTPLPPPLGSGELVFWRLDEARFASRWDSGDGSFLAGGRWNSRGRRAVYAALDPATAILEVAVHKGFETLDLVPHILTAARIADSARVHVVPPAEIPEPAWLEPGMVTPQQQAFGDNLLRTHAFAALPSTVSSHSWNLVFDPARPEPLHDLVLQEAFVLDPRLHPRT